MLAGRKEKRIVPHEEGQWMEFQTVSGAELDEAQEREAQRSLSLFKGIDLSALQGLAAGQKISGNLQEVTKELGYDKDILIHYGISSWSLEEPCTNENKRRLDAQTRDWAISVILEMNVRPLANSGDSGNDSAEANSHRNSEALIDSSPVA